MVELNSRIKKKLIKGSGSEDLYFSTPQKLFTYLTNLREELNAFARAVNRRGGGEQEFQELDRETREIQNISMQQKRWGFSRQEWDDYIQNL